MKIIKATLILAALASAAISAPVFANGGRGHHFRGHNHHYHSRARVGVFIGAPLVFAPWYYSPPYYYYPPAAVVHTPPPVYVERGQAAAPADDTQYWYYCRESETYYPYVKECAGPWQRVVPQAPPS